MPPERIYSVKGKIDFETKLKLDRYKRTFNVTESQVIQLALKKFFEERK